MKKLVLAAFFVLTTIGVSAQKIGDWYIGADAGYVTNYKDIVYGLRTSYNITEPLEISASFLMNPKITAEDSDGTKSESAFYSYNLDLTYYVLMQNSWSMGPTIGGQYLDYSIKYQQSAIGDKETFNALAVNLGWRLHFDLSDNVKLTGGWHYSVGQEETRYHLFYLGLGYCFNFY